MPVQVEKTGFRTLGPPGSQEGYREIVLPSPQCLPAASSDGESAGVREPRGISLATKHEAPTVTVPLL
jgi:hypothetical protein